jgi:Tol biopolymer transport system component
MPSVAELLEREGRTVDLEPDSFERLIRRRDREARNRRMGAAVLAIIIAIASFAALVRSFGSAERPATEPRPKPQPRNGEWVVISVSSLDPGARPMSRGKPANLFVAGPGGSARLLAGTEGDSTLQQCPAFSPDGSMLAYGQTGAGEKTLVMSGFSSAGELEGPTSRIRVPWAKSFVGPCPVWSPDGQRLATIAPGLGVLIVDLDGTTHLVGLDAYGLVEGGTLALRWSPDGSQLALLVASGPSHETVWLVPADGGAVHALAGFDPDTGDIAWTADGRSVLAVGGACCPEGRPFVEVVDVATGDIHEVPLPQAWNGSGVWGIVGSKDDRFLVWRGWNVPLAWLDLRGNVTPVHLEDPMTTVPTLSPDGRQLLYVTYGRALGPGQTLIAVPLDGGAPTRYSPSTDAFGDNYATYAWQPR